MAIRHYPAFGWSLQGRPERWRTDIRRIAASGLVAIGVLLALFAGVFRYVDQHFHSPETFFENTTQLADDADVRQRLFEGFRQEIIDFADRDVEEEGTAPGLNSLADDEAVDPVTAARNARDEAIEDELLDVFDLEIYDSVFNTALQQSQAELIASAELEPAALLRDKGDVLFNMQSLYPSIWDELRSNPLTADITVAEPPAGSGVFKIADRDTTMNFLWSMLRNGPNWRGLTTLGAIAALIGAVAIADRRPSTAIQFGGGMVGLAVVFIVIIYLIRFVVPLLAGGGTSAKAVVAVYAANLAPLVGTLIRTAILGVVLAALGGLARYFWPDDWVYSSVSDDRGVRSIRRRRGSPEPTPAPAPQRPLQPAAMAPGYAGYAQQYPGYPQQQWGPQPHPGQYAPGYPAPYPAGPYAQPSAPMPQQHYTSPGRPTVPVMPVDVSAKPGSDLVPPAAPPLDAKPGDLPADAAQIVPRVVATTSPSTPAAKDTVAESDAAQPATPAADGNDDGWAGENDW